MPPAAFRASAVAASRLRAEARFDAQACRQVAIFPCSRTQRTLRG